MAADPAVSVLKSPFALCRWELDARIPAALSAEVAAGFCGALLKRLGPAVNEIVVDHRLSVFAMPAISTSDDDPGIVGVGLAVPRRNPDRNVVALRRAICSIGQDGFHVGSRELRLRIAKARAISRQRWTGPSTTWTSVTPWVMEGDRLDPRSAQARAGMLDAFADALSGGDNSGLHRATVAGAVEGVEISGQPWLGEMPHLGNRNGHARRRAYIRVGFRAPVEGPLVIGRDRLLGMGLLAPVPG